MDIEHHLWIFLISAAPIVELRLAIPLAIHVYDLPWASSLLVSLLGNLMIVPFLLLFLERGLRLLSRIKIFAGILDWIFERTSRSGTIIEKYHRIGLVLLVAIPLPGTGAWTGSLAASLLRMEFKRALLLITVGILIAGVIVTALSLLGLIGTENLPSYLKGE